MKFNQIIVYGGFFFLLSMLITTIGCETSGKTGALAGGGLGALVGQAIGGNTQSTLIGAAVGTGIGYIIGNEKDKKKAQEINRQPVAEQRKQVKLSPLAGTRWQVVSLQPRAEFPEFASKLITFGKDGFVTTTTTTADGTVTVDRESYRVVGGTLIVNKPDYLINAKFAIDGEQLIIDAEDFRAVLRQLK